MLIMFSEWHYHGMCYNYPVLFDFQFNIFSFVMYCVFLNYVSEINK